MQWKTHSSLFFITHESLVLCCFFWETESSSDTLPLLFTRPPRSALDREAGLTPDAVPRRCLLGILGSAQTVTKNPLTSWISARCGSSADFTVTRQQRDTRGSAGEPKWSVYGHQMPFWENRRSRRQVFIWHSDGQEQNVWKKTHESVTDTEASRLRQEAGWRGGGRGVVNQPLRSIGSGRKSPFGVHAWRRR